MHIALRRVRSRYAPSLTRPYYIYLFIYLFILLVPLLCVLSSPIKPVGGRRFGSFFRASPFLFSFSCTEASSIASSHPLSLHHCGEYFICVLVFRGGTRKSLAHNWPYVEKLENLSPVSYFFFTSSSGTRYVQFVLSTLLRQYSSLEF